jgi:hypothetical protein
MILAQQMSNVMLEFLATTYNVYRYQMTQSEVPN